MTPLRSMDAATIRWLISTAKQNYWRVSSLCDIEDLIQDGYVCYARMVDKYKDVTDRPHLMSLFQRCYYNHIHDLAKQQRREQAMFADLPQPNEVDPETFTFHMLVDRAPMPIRRMLALLGTEEGRRKLRVPYRMRLDGRETFNSRLCRLCGLNADDYELPSLIINYFSNGL